MYGVHRASWVYVARVVDVKDFADGHVAYGVYIACSVRIVTLFTLCARPA